MFSVRFYIQEIILLQLCVDFNSNTITAMLLQNLCYEQAELR